MDSPASVADVLNRAADLLEKPGAWTQGEWARDKNGEGEPLPGSDVCWCAYGACYAVNGYTWRGCGLDVVYALDQWSRANSYPSIQHFNDEPGRTQAEVVAALREAARQSERPS